MRRRNIFLASALLAIAGLLAWQMWPVQEEPAFATGTAKDIDIGQQVFVLADSNLSDDENNVIDQVPSGTIFTVLKVKNQSVFVEHHKSRKSGWIDFAHICRIDVSELNRLSGKIATDPNNSSLHACIGTIHLLRGDFDAALAGYDEALRLRPTDVWYHNRGVVWRNKKDFDRAIADFGKSIEMNSQYSLSFSDRGRTWMEKGNPDKALVDFNEAIRLDPSDSGSFLGRGMCWNEKHSYDDALRDFDESLRLDPNLVNSLVYRGRLRRTRGQLDDAEVDFDNAIRLEPSNAGTLISRGELRLANLQPHEAIADLDAAIQLAPNNVEVYYYRGLAHLLLRQTESLDDFSQLHTHIQNAPAGLARVYGHLAAQILGDLPKAESFLDIETADWPRDWHVHTIRYLRGELDRHEWLMSANTAEKMSAAHCYLGLQAVADHQDERAHQHFCWVRDGCHTKTMEFVIAVNELKRIETRSAPKD